MAPAAGAAAVVAAAAAAVGLLVGLWVAGAGPSQSSRPYWFLCCLLHGLPWLEKARVGRRPGQRWPLPYFAVSLAASGPQSSQLQAEMPLQRLLAGLTVAGILAQVAVAAVGLELAAVIQQLLGQCRQRASQMAQEAQELQPEWLQAASCQQGNTPCHLLAGPLAPMAPWSHPHPQQRLQPQLDDAGKPSTAAALVWAAACCVARILIGRLAPAGSVHCVDQKQRLLRGLPRLQRTRQPPVPRQGMTAGTCPMLPPVQAC